MPQINTVYLIGHTHTDIGYTDHQTVLFRQHAAFLDRAVDLCEATADYPAEAQFKWTCELASTVEHFMATRSSRDIDRFLALHKAGRMAVNAMAYHWTPMLSPAAMVRSLYTGMRLRRDYGLNLVSAMQCDVDGASWLWADLLPALGIQGLTMSINTFRGDRPRPWLHAFQWEGPGGSRLLTFNGPHYAYGLFFYGLTSLERAIDVIPQVTSRLEASDDYPYDFLYAQVTHPALVDNGPPYEIVSDLVRDWNAAGRTPRLVFTTVDGFLAMLNARYGSQAPVWRGDWADWWADGVGSSAYETAVNRTTEALLPALDLLAAQVQGMDLGMIEEAYRLVSLYDEHTWGSFNSIDQPHHPFTRAHWNAKAGFAYEGFSLTHEYLAHAGRKLARSVTGRPPEGDVFRAWTQGESEMFALDETQRFLVVNPLSWERRVLMPIPHDSGGRAPHNFLDAYLAANYRDGYPGDRQSSPDRALEREKSRFDPAAVLDVTLPAFGWAVVAPRLASVADHATAGDGIIANRWYRVEVDPATGGLLSWYDNEQGRELASGRGAWRFGQYVYELTDSQEGRAALFHGDFRIQPYGTQRTHTPLRRQGPSQVRIGPAHIDALGVSVEVFMQAPGARSVRVRYSLPHDEKALHVDMVIDKDHVTAPEAVYVMFPCALDQPRFHLDLNGVALEPDAEQLNGSCRDWYGIQRWAEVGDEHSSIVLAPIDAPLVQVGGIQTGRWLRRLEPTEPTLVSWPVNNYWTTNFVASQGGELLFRYRLTSMPAYDPAAAGRFAAASLVPPAVVRVAGAEEQSGGAFLRVTPEGVADVQMKRAEDGSGLVVHAFNLTPSPQKLTLTFPAHIASARACTPTEDPGAELAIDGGSLHLDVPPRSLASVKVTLRS